MSFHVPEPMRNTTHPFLGSTSANGNNGVFELASPEPGWQLACVASDGRDWQEEQLPGVPWEHVSVHAYRRDGRTQRTPTWKEMAYVKRLFWDGEDLVVQFHPRKSEYVNMHLHTLHLWRPVGIDLPTPPVETVGVLA